MPHRHERRRKQNRTRPTPRQTQSIRTAPAENRICRQSQQSRHTDNRFLIVEQRFPIPPVGNQQKVGNQQRLFVIMDFQPVEQYQHHKPDRSEIQGTLPLSRQHQHTARQKDKQRGCEKIRPAVVRPDNQHQRRRYKQKQENIGNHPAPLLKTAYLSRCELLSKACII